MTEGATNTEDTPIIFDGWRSISISLYMALIGYSVMVTMPVLSTALVTLAGFTEEQVGRVWGADLYGLSIGVVIAAVLVARVNRREKLSFRIAQIGDRVEGNIRNGFSEHHVEDKTIIHWSGGVA